jgi:hypothetical protein
MSIYDIRDNNVIQPNRMFSIHGEVAFIDKEVQYTKLILNVFNYDHANKKPDQLTVHFKLPAKKVVDMMVKLHSFVIVMGDIIVKDSKIFFDGKIIEFYKETGLITEENAKYVDPKEANYDRAF